MKKEVDRCKERYGERYGVKRWSRENKLDKEKEIEKRKKAR